MDRTPRMNQPSLRLTRQGHLVLEPSAEASEIDEAVAMRLSSAFAHGGGYGLLQLGAGEVGRTLPPVFLWWRAFAVRYVAALCLQSSVTDGDPAASSRIPDIAAPTEGELASLVLTAPMMAGAEYLTPDVLRALWREIAAALAQSVAAAKTDLQSLLKGLNPAWNLVGRVHFNLAENRRDEAAPFAFMATYTTRLSAQAKAQHLPLGEALPGSGRSSMRGKYSIRSAGHRRRPPACWPARRIWKMPASLCACPRRGARTGRRVPRLPERSAHARRRRSASTGCWISGWRSPSTGRR
jgi:hypothetical protein